MLASNIPVKIPEPFATNATSGTTIRTIPQNTSTFGAASWSLGFPPETFTNPSAGGIPPDGRDENGVLNNITAWLQWVQAGGAPIVYDATFQASILPTPGYPNGAIVQSAVSAGSFWRSTVDNNITNPDTGGAGWVSAIATPIGQCYLAYASATQIALKQHNGTYIRCGGIIFQIPNTGVTGANTSVLVNNVASQNLAASTNYYVSCYWNGSALALAYWQFGTYAHIPDTSAYNAGCEVISNSGTPISGHTLVGMLNTNGSSQFQSQLGLVRSWFNSPSIVVQTSVGGFSTTASNAEATGLRTNILTWANESMMGAVSGDGYVASGQFTVSAWPIIDGGAFGPVGGGTTPGGGSGSNYPTFTGCTGVVNPTEGLHVYSGEVGNGGSASSVLAVFAISLALAIVGVQK